MIFIDSSLSPTLDNQIVDVKLPYAEGTDSLLVVADSSNNRIVILDGKTHKFIEQIGNGRTGYREGSFADAEFSLPQGICHFINAEA